MAAIALAESGGDPNATHRNSDGTVDRGLWQINSSHGYGTSSLDPNQNIKQAVGVYHSQGLTAWATFTSGAYLKYLPRNFDKIALNNYLKQHNGKPPGTAGLTPGIKHLVTNPVGTTTNAVSQGVNDIAGPIESTVMMGLKEAMYAFAIFGGLMLVLLGLGMIGLDVGLGGFQRVNRHPVVKYVNRRTSSGGGSGPPVEDTSTGDLPGPEA